MSDPDKELFKISEKNFNWVDFDGLVVEPIQLRLLLGLRSDLH